MDRDDEEDEVLCEGLWPAELGYLHTPPSALSLSISQLGREEELLQDAL